MTPQLLKPAVTNALLELLAPIQEEFQKSHEWQEIASKAYPIAEVKKKEKKAKNLGSRYPGAVANVKTKPDGHVEGEDGQGTNLANGVNEAIQNLELSDKADVETS